MTVASPSEPVPKSPSSAPSGEDIHGGGDRRVKHKEIEILVVFQADALGGQVTMKAGGKSKFALNGEGVKLRRTSVKLRAWCKNGAPKNCGFRQTC